MLTPFEFFNGRLRLPLFLHRISERNEALRRIRAPVKQDILHQLKHGARDFLVNLQHSRVHNPHVQARLNGMKKERGMHRFAHGIVASEAERNVRYPAAHARMRQVFLDPAGGFQEIHSIVAMLLDTRRNRKNVRIKNDVLRRKMRFLNQQLVGAPADLHAALEGISLPFLVKRHHDHRRPQAPHLARGFEELLLPFLLFLVFFV